MSVDTVGSLIVVIMFLIVLALMTDWRGRK